jgi:hypothetical protein
VGVLGVLRPGATFTKAKMIYRLDFGADVSTNNGDELGATEKYWLSYSDILCFINGFCIGS